MRTSTEPWRADRDEYPQQFTPLQNAVLLVKQMQAKLDAVEASQTEPIAIVGAGCRFPGGGDSPAAFWRMLCDGVDAIREIPEGRWDVDAYYDPDPSAPGKMYTRWGGFLDGVDQFDPDFFGISPREALRIDPQQRLLLETTWEALEHAGLPPAEIAETRTGVFVGIIGNDYAQIQCHNPAELDAFCGTGNAHSIAANRLSYLLNLRGPSVALDTACSSSLVTVHLACQSLRRGETDLALAGGVNLILGPDLTIALSKARMLSPDGRCKTFDAEANGYVRGEGCGMVVLKRLSDAESDGDSILAVIRGTAVNHDGRSNGLSAPSGPAQQEVISAALADAGLEPAEIGYIEAHGTGTRLGDPIEVEALLAVLGQGRTPDRPLMIGSVKTNIGHLEAAAGIAGLIKASLVLRHDLIPPHLNIQKINPLLAAGETPLVIPTARRPWPRGDRPRYAGVSSFGFGGTNAHLVLEDPPAERPVENRVERPRHVLTAAARTVPALAEMVGRLQGQLAAEPSASLADVAFTANTGRSHFAHRIAVVADSAEGLQRQLQTYTSGKRSPAVRTGHVQDEQAPPLVFLFTGQGSQYLGMGRTLYETQPTFREALNRGDEILRPYLEQSLLEVLDPRPLPSGGDSHLLPNGPASPLDQTAYTQPALFALEYALAEMWRSWGVEPTAVMGHSVGEYVAACVAGVFSLEDGLRLIAQRARLMQALPPGGSMAAVFAAEATVGRALQPYGDRIAIAGLNGPENVVISGEEEVVGKILATLKAEGVNSKRVATSHAFHSPLMEPMLDALEQAAASVELAAPKIELISNLTGLPVEPGRAKLDDDQTLSDPAYWRRHARQPVKFAAGMQSLAERGYRTFVEIGPQATLSGMGRRCLPGEEFVWLPSLRRGRDDWQTVLESLATLYTLGVKVDWPGFDRDYARRRVELPSYPFQRKPYWSGANVDRDRITGSAPRGGQKPSHPLLGRRFHAPTAEVIFQSRLSSTRPAILGDHCIQGKAVLPAAAYLEMALAAAATLGPGPWSLEEVNVLQPLVLEATSARTVQTILAPEGGGEASFRIVSLEDAAPNEEPSFTTHAAGRIRAESPDGTETNTRTVDLAHHRARFTGEPFDHEWRANALHASGLDPGPAFRWTERHWLNEGDTLGEMRAPRDALPSVGHENALPNGRADTFQIHPGLLDCGFQLLGAALPGAGTGIDAYVPVGLRRLRLFERPTGQTWYLVSLQTDDGNEPRQARSDLAVGNARLVDQLGHVLMEIEGLRLRRVPRDWLARVTAGPEPDWLYELAWKPQPLDASPQEKLAAEPGRWLIFDDSEGVGGALARELEAHGECCRVARPFDAVDTAAEPIRALVKQFISDDAAPWRGVVYAAGLDVGAGEESDRLDLRAARRQGWGGVLDLLHALTEAGLSQPPRLWLLSRGAEAVGAEPFPLAVSQAPVWGLGRVIAAEHPELACVRIDLDPAGGNGEIGALFEEVRSGGHEDQVALRAGARHVARLTRLDKSHRAEPDQAPQRPLEIPQGQPYRLEITSRGELGNLALRPVVRRGPGPGEVEIRVRATGLNFRDVLNVLGLYPGDAGPLGGECAGEIVAVGAAVRGLAPGQEVVALAPGSFGKFVTTLAAFTVPKPEHLSFEEAATIPIAMLTADYALRRLGRMRAGDRVLIHAASGGVGLAAVQLAQKAGAQVFATAGNREKRAFLRSLGIEHVMDSRSLEFAEQIHERTAGRGVDLVLNSLTGESIAKSLSVLAPGGRFLEIGKTDLWDPQRVAEVNPDVSFHAIALDRMMADDPQAVGAMLRELMAEFEAETLEPLPHRVFPIQDAVEAMRHMARAKHIGKVVITTGAGEPSSTSEPHTSAGGQLTLAEDATYLITGGLGGLGLKVAAWMVNRGARHLVLMGRSGASEEARAALKKLEEAGAQVTVGRADVARRDEVAAVLREIDASGRPLRGVIHAAGVLDDGVLREQTHQRFDRVMAPKVEGAWNLHVLLRDRPLDFFVLFSSAASLLGSPGQGNYAAANAFLDALAHRRRAEGLTALAVNWGSWSEVGMAAALQQTEGPRWEASGMGWIDPPRGLQTLEQLILQDRARAGVLPIDWPKFFQRIPPGAEPPWLAEMAHQGGLRTAVAGEPNKLLRQLEGVTPGERPELVLTFVRRQAAGVLGTDASEEPDPRRPLNELGFDSLMAVELCNILGHAIGRHLNPTLLFDYPTLEALAGHLAQDVLQLQSPDLASAGHENVPASGRRALLARREGAPPHGEEEDNDQLQRTSPADLDAQTLAEVKGLSVEQIDALVADAIAQLES